MSDKLPAMERSLKWRQITVTAVAMLYIALFVYAALSKLLDFSAFRMQLSQSPLLSAHAQWLSWLVPSIEILLAVLLSFPKTRLWALFFSLNLMVMFAAYIYIILHYGSFVPCSCGGILEKMGWKEHLIFNIVFVFLAITAFVFESGRVGFRPLYYTLAVLGSAVASVAFVTVLFLSSERIVHHENRFLRRFPHPSVKEAAKADLKVNSYYIAGIFAGKIYLGNYTAPRRLLVYDTHLQHGEEVVIQLERKDFPFRSLHVRVNPPFFYVTDGTVPCIYKGLVADWSARLVPANVAAFTQAEPFAKGLAVRAFSPQTGENILGFQDLYKSGPVSYNPSLLKKQIDGIFDTDGSLLTAGRRLVYLYRYRNEFLVADSALRLQLKGKTIDTVSRAQIRIAYDTMRRQKKFKEKPLIVNKMAALYKNLLFVNSNLPGKDEEDELWHHASIIDVYDVRDGSYRFSFPLYDIDGKKMDSFKVCENAVYLINDKWIVRYDLKKKLLDDYEDTPGRVQGSDRKPVKE